MSLLPILQEELADVTESGVVIPLTEDRSPVRDIVPHACFDACSRWLELAMRYASDAQVAKLARVEGWEGSDEAARHAALEWEFETSMQSIVAAGTAMDALGVMLQTRVDLPHAVADRWREHGTSRYAQIAEIIERALSLNAKATTALVQNVREILRFRDLATGATPRLDGPIMHPEFRSGFEWRFVYFRCENALMIVCATSRLVWEISASGKAKDPDLQRYLDSVRSRIEAIPSFHRFRTWKGGNVLPVGELASGDIVSPARFQSGLR